MDIQKLISGKEYRKALRLPPEVTETYELLAQGEYNVNYIFTHPLTNRQLLLRVNMGSQMHLDRQIEYEAHALELLSGSGRTPFVYYVDGTHRYIDHGILVMEYLPGRYPVYESADDMRGVMECMADIHSVSIPEDEVVYGEPFGENAVPADTVKLIAPGSATGAILDECESMLAVYMESPLGDSETKRRLRRLLDKGHEIAQTDSEYLDTEADVSEDAGSTGWETSTAASACIGNSNCEEDEASAVQAVRCCINTELNSTNFLVDDGNGGFVRLVDWEKPLYGDPAQDLGHLLAPTTTFWKTDTVLKPEETDRLIDIYLEAVRGRYDTTGLKERTNRLITITCLRGLTWCAMAWIEYQDPTRPLSNESTRKKLDDYLSDSFISQIETRFGI